MQKRKTGAVIVAGGRGRRMGSEVPKQFMQIGGRTILEMTVSVFEKQAEIDEIVIVINEENIDTLLEMQNRCRWLKTRIVSGGPERYHSVFKGLSALSPNTEIVLIHDGVRPFVKERHISEVLEGARACDACILAVPVKDTIKVVEKGIVSYTPDRAALWSVQTPQAFKYKMILKGYEDTMDDNNPVTDDAMLMERLGHKVHIVRGDYSNIKITTKEDLIFANGYLLWKEDESVENS